MIIGVGLLRGGSYHPPRRQSPEEARRVSARRILQEAIFYIIYSYNYFLDVQSQINARGVKILAALA